MTLTTARSVKVADEVWVIVALLHRENPSRADFTVKEIADRARQEAINGEYKQAIYVHAFQHCVANRPPDRGRYRMLFATGKLTRRLFRTGDNYHPDREGSKIHPSKTDLPSKYHVLIDWYFKEYCLRPEKRELKDSILALCGLGKEIWAGENPDDYVRRLREGWE